MAEKIALGFAIVISLISMLLAAAPFTPAVAISLLMLLLTGFIGFKGRLQTALVLLFLNTLAVIGSPATDLSDTDALIGIPLLFLIAFGGILLGVRRLMSL
ncbi:DUF6419 family natural product biosynthesis protein [Marinobacterium jannaschii]|uniref:DUF6419 family natural product biosynthesis protein n=1 Tax=Marinobacterium jannaschii TaxID=64970 RepID=UPI000562CDA4|nr:DUF6419 family natural product biosynthesis protein [Marinobacterium jannaschii]